jgi:hypothetical protein
MSEADRPDSTNVPRQALIDLAVECWRLGQWVFANPVHAKAPARRAAERLEMFLKGLRLEMIDLTGKPYDPGLAVEVLGLKDGSSSETVGCIVDETVSPIVMYNGIVAKYGQVVLRWAQPTNRSQEVKQ